MLQALRRFVQERVGVVSRDDLVASRKTVARSEERLTRAVEKNVLRLAKRLDRLDKQIDTLTKYVARLDAVAQTGRLRKIEYNVDALIRKAFLDGQLPEPQATLARRFRGLSEHEEDGITVALFHRVGAATHRFIEIGAGVNGGNCGFLAKELGWTGLMVDIDPGRVARLQRRFAPAVAVAEARVTRENVNELITSHGLAGDIDLLSIDIDGIDYWVWEQLTACRARVVIVEYNPFLGADRAVTVPYDPAFNRHRFDVPRFAYYGASLPALVKLGARKGYRLVLVEPRGVNAFFVREDIAADVPPLRVAGVPIAPEAIADFGPDGIYPFLDRSGLVLIEID
jgi:hypothetical protein